MHCPTQSSSCLYLSAQRVSAIAWAWPPLYHLSLSLHVVHWVSSAVFQKCCSFPWPSCSTTLMVSFHPLHWVWNCPELGEHTIVQPTAPIWSCLSLCRMPLVGVHPHPTSISASVLDAWAGFLPSLHSGPASKGRLRSHRLRGHSSG